MLVVVEDRDLHALAQRLLDVEALRRLDVLEVDATEGGLERGDDVDQLFLVEFLDLDVEHVDTGKLLEQDALALHHRFGREGTDGAEAEHCRAVGDHAHQVGADREFGGRCGIADDLVAGGGDAGRIGQRQVALRGQGLGRNDLDFARPGDAMVTESAVGQFICQAGLPHPITKRAARRVLPTSGNLELPFSIDPALVRPRRLELPRLAALAPQASASTNSAMAAPDRRGGGYQIAPAVARRVGQDLRSGPEIPILPLWIDRNGAFPTRRCLMTRRWWLWRRASPISGRAMHAS